MARVGDIFLGRYELLRELPAPGFVGAFLAMDNSLQRQVEITLLKPQFAAHASFTDRFLAEAKKVMELDDPSIARVYDVGRDPVSGSCFIIAEQVEGQVLTQYVRGSTPSATRATTIIRDVAGGLDRLGHGADAGLVRASDRRGATGFHMGFSASAGPALYPALAASDARTEAAGADRRMRTDDAGACGRGALPRGRRRRSPVWWSRCRLRARGSALAAVDQRLRRRPLQRRPVLSKCWCPTSATSRTWP